MIDFENQRIDKLEQLIATNSTEYKSSEVYTRLQGRLQRARERNLQQLVLKEFIEQSLLSLKCYASSFEGIAYAEKMTALDIRAMLHMLQLENTILVKDGYINLLPTSCELSSVFTRSLGI